jgi:signal transduction histidine kinase
MAAERKFQSSRWIFLYGIIFIGLVSLRCVTQNAREQNLVPSLVGLSLFSMLYFSEQTISKRLKWYINAYLAIQAVLILYLFSLSPFVDAIGVLFILLGLQATRALPQRSALGWVIGFGIALFLTEMWGAGLLGGLVVSMLIAAVGIFLVSYDMLYTRAQIEKDESQALLERLAVANQQLEENAAQAEELAATQERNRLARELHDSVSQSIFSIILTARSAQLLLERDPERVPEQLLRLQEMTGDALSQLRSLITQMRPQKNE